MGRCTCWSTALASRLKAKASGTPASMAALNAGSGARSTSELTRNPWKSGQLNSPRVGSVMRPYYLSCWTRSRPIRRSPPSPPTVPSTRASVMMPSLPGAPPQSFRPERTPSPGSPTPPGPSLGTKSCAHRSASVGPSGDDGAAITAEAGPRPRCTASSCWANACPRGTSTVRWPSSKSGSRS